MKYPNFAEEKKLWRKGYKFVIGLDEAGRGPLAGPVVAAAVTVAPNSFLRLPSEKLLIPKVNDSKKLSPKRREELYKLITNNPSIEWGIGRVSEKIIDRINIKNAAELAMEKALKNLEKKMRKRADFLLFDGNHLASLKLKIYSLKLIVKGDAKVFSCAAASIIAKVDRDGIMEEYHRKYPQHRFDKHKGYPTKLHLKMLKKYGICQIHRKSFKPVKKYKIKRS